MIRHLKLPMRKKRLVVEAVSALWIAAFLRLVIPFRHMAAMVSHPEPPYPDDAKTRELIAEIRWAVAATARRVPWRAVCYEQGFAVQWLLRRRGVPVTLHYGVKREPGEELAAHVWARSGSIDVIGCQNASDYAELAQFPPAR